MKNYSEIDISKINYIVFVAEKQNNDFRWRIDKPEKRILVVEPWIVAYLSRTRKEITQNIKEEIQHLATTVSGVSLTASGTAVRPRTSPSNTASVRNHS